MRLLIGPQDLAHTYVRARLIDMYVPVVALEVEGGVCCPQLQHHIDAFDRHQAQSSGIRGQIEQAEIRGDAGLAEAAHQPAAREMVQHRQTDCHVDRVVEGCDRHARPKLDRAGAGHCIGDEDVVRGHWLPFDRVMLADPGLGIPKRLGPHDQLQVLFKDPA